MDQRHRALPHRFIACRDDARALFLPGLAKALREMLWIAHLDGERRLIGLRLRYSSSARSVPFSVRAVVEDAIALGSHGLVMAHNHPSGDPRPSAADLEATRMLARIAEPMGVRLHDHLVFAGPHCVSLREAGYL